MYDNISIIVPSLNPDEKLLEVADGLIDAGFTDIILVDDGSDEEHKHYFKDIQEKYGEDRITILTHEVNKGKGRAIKTSIAYVLENRPDTEGIVTVDGDNQHKPEDVKKCLDKMKECKNAVILGCRDFDQDDVPFKSRNGNKITRTVFRLVCGMKISDTQTGLRAIPAEHLKFMLDIKGERYEYETNMLLEMGDNKIPYDEVKIRTVYIDDNSSSHFHAVKDSIRIYSFILKFALSSVISSVVDIAAFRLLLLVVPSKLGFLTDTTIAGFIARAISSFVNFTVNRKAVFDSKSSVGKSLVKYYILVVCQITASVCIVSGLVKLFGVSGGWLKTLKKAVVDIILFFLSFRIQKKWVFKK